MLVGVPSGHIDLVWETVAPMLRKAVERGDGRYELSDIEDAVRTEKQQLWVWLNDTVRAAIVTEIVQWPRKRGLVVCWAGGHDMSEWLPQVLITLDDFARTHACDFIQGGGRDGWGRVSGFRRDAVFIKDL